MRILHLFSDYRLTGPADPVLTLVEHLRRRGVDALLACPATTGNAKRTTVGERAAAMGLEPVLSLKLSRYFHPLDWAGDVRRLRRMLVERRIDILHTHLSHDHLLAFAAVRLGKRKVTLIRSNHKGTPLSDRPLVPRRSFRWFTDAYVGFSVAAAEKDRVRFGLDEDRVCVIDPALDLAKYANHQPGKDARAEMGLGERHVVGAVVARIQRHRRWGLLLEAAKRAAPACPDLRVWVIGAGTHRHEAVIDPAKKMGLTGKVVQFPGYRKADYLDYLAAIDFKIFLQPGSDGTCRAAREAMAMGKPVIATRLGMLPEIIRHEETGLLVDPEPGSLQAAMQRLYADPALRRRLGAAAKAEAFARFDPAKQAERVERFYRRLVG